MAEKTKQVAREVEAESKSMTKTPDAIVQSHSHVIATFAAGGSQGMAFRFG
jgi:hypothetical protein